MNSFGRLFRISIFGESHGNLVGVLIDGCPAGISLDVDDFLIDLQRRKSGGEGTTPRIEQDLPVLQSGVLNGFTTGAPIMIYFLNENVKRKDYAAFSEQPRPGHADFTALQKFGGYADLSGGGAFSGRLTLGLVAAGVIAKKIIHPAVPEAVLIEAGGRKDIQQAVREAMESQDSIGGLVACSVQSMPVALGEPFFDSLESVISHLVFSVPAIKGIEFGSGFAAAAMRGSEHNDTLLNSAGETLGNKAGGINGGISNGNTLSFRVAVKPTSSIAKSQESYSFSEKKVIPMKIAGRHDACIALRVPVIIEAVTAIALADFMLIAQQRKPVFNPKL